MEECEIEILSTNENVEEVCQILQNFLKKVSVV